MATFSLGTSGVAPGAPGVYINEQAGKLANAGLADFSTVYMLVETEEDVPVTQFPFNSPTAITSLNDYKELIKVGNSTVPEERIPLLSYNCVNEFFENAQVGDLRVVRVGTPNEIAEIEFLPSGTKINTTDLPSGLIAGNTVYVQMTINGQKLVTGDGSTGYTSGGEWLGVPVEIPVTYVAGDEVNNRKISAAFVTAVVAAIESNPSIRTSVYVRSSGLTNDLDPAGNSETGYVNIAASTFDGSVNVVTQVLPVGSNFVLMQNGYNVSNIVGQSTNLVRTPQDYTQCIGTAFDGQQDQGYLITPTAYAQFDAEGRATVGAAAAAHCESNNFKWMARADPGPFLVTDINEYSSYTPHSAAANLVTGLKYLVDNVIYEWTGIDVTYDRLTTQDIVFGQSAQTAVNESANLVAANTKVGLLDEASYTVAAVPTAANGLFSLNTTNWWPVTLPIQKVTLTTGAVGNDFNAVSIQGQAGTFDLNGTEVYVVAPPYNTLTDSEYSLNNVFLATTAADASAIYDAVVLATGSASIVAPPTGAVYLAAPTGDTATLAYADPYWDLPVDINGQTSDLIENVSGGAAGVNTLHLPGTLQDATATYRLLWNSRTILDANASIATYAGTEIQFSGAATFSVTGHGLRNGQKISFTQPVVVSNGSTTSNLVEQTTKTVSYDYWVKVVDADNFVLSNSLNNYTVGAYIGIPSGFTIQTYPTILYTRVMGGGLTSTTPGELLTLPLVRGRKYEFDTSSVFEEAAVATAAPAPSASAPQVSIYLNNSSLILGEDQITPYGEDLTSPTECEWLPKFNLVAPTTTPSALTTNAYCVPTVDQFFSTNAYFVPAIDPIYAGTYDAAGVGTDGPIPVGTAGLGAITSAAGLVDGTYYNISLTGGTGSGAVATVTVAGNAVTVVSITDGGNDYVVGDTLTVGTTFGATTVAVAAVEATGLVAASTAYALAAGQVDGDSGNDLVLIQSRLVGLYYDVIGAGVTPDGVSTVAIGDRMALTYDGTNYTWVVVAPVADGGDLTSVGQPCYQVQVLLTFTPEQTPPSNLWRFDAVTSSEIISDALRGIGFNGVAQATEVEAGVDNVNRLFADSQRYSNPFGFIAYYGPYVENGAGQFIPPSPYVTGVASRRYRAEGYQFPPAGVKYQLADAVSSQIPISSAQQNLLNPDGCNAIRTLPGYPQTAVFIWGGRTRLGNPLDAQQKLYQFVNTRVILNVVYGSLRSAFDSQIFNVIDGFGVVYNQIISVGNSILNQLYVRGALYGAKPSDAFQVICDNRINSAEDLDNGLVNAKVFVTPVPTLERIQIDLIRVALGKMQQELDVQGLGGQ